VARTLCIDVGGTGIKALVVDDAGQPVTERARVATPRPATPDSVLTVIAELAAGQGAFDRVSVGFPGVVTMGITRTAPNLDEGWTNFRLADAVADRLGRPTRAANDAGVQGLGVVEGVGTEAVVTLGTGMGFGLYVDGRYVPNIELGHHPLRKGMTYEERVCDDELQRIGLPKWKRRVLQALAQIRHTFNFRVLYLGGGNARHFAPEELPPDVMLVDNIAGLLGGVRLWQ
jgi:polyphosphate glucokinase